MLLFVLLSGANMRFFKQNTIGFYHVENQRRMVLLKLALWF